MLPGRGIKEELPQVSRFQRMKVALEYGLKYPYVPRAIMEKIGGEESRIVRGRDLAVSRCPKNMQKPKFHSVLAKVLGYQGQMEFGPLHLQKQNIINKAGCRDQEWSANMWGPDGMEKVPDPNL